MGNTIDKAKGEESKKKQPKSNLDQSLESIQPNSEEIKTMTESGSASDLDSIPLELAPEDISVGEAIGEGVYSEVYRGFCYGTQTAIKRFKNQSFDAELLNQVAKEVRIMKSIRHPNLLLFLGACTKPGQLMIVTELMDKSFHDLNSSTLTLFTKLRMAREAAKGISWLHLLSPAIVHRDLKPENILCDESNKVVKVADFGLSLVKDHSNQEAEEMKKIRGSPAFMSPEALQGKHLTTKTDVYSFGMILWELLTGESPYEDFEIESFEQLIEEVCEKGTREKIPETCPPALRKLIESCWQKDPDNRPNFLEILAQLDEALLEVAIDDLEGRKWWKQNFSQNSLQLEVPWKTLLPILIQHPSINFAIKDRVFVGVKCMLDKDDRGMVSIEEFGNILKWFGPFGPSGKDSSNFIARMEDLFRQKWFHGDIDTKTAQTRLAGTDPGTFLIRFSSNPGAYALSKIIQNHNNERVIVHIRISHKPGEGFSFVLDDQTYQFESLEKLVECELLHLVDACPGSRYFADYRIQQVVSGYISSTYT